MQLCNLLMSMSAILCLATITVSPVLAADYTLKIAYETSDMHIKARTANDNFRDVMAAMGRLI